HRLTPEEIAATAKAAEQFRFLEREAGSLLLAAPRYPLSFPEVSTVLMSTKSASQAETNFGEVPGHYLAPDTLDRIEELQKRLGLGAPSLAGRLIARMKQAITRLLPRAH